MPSKMHLILRGVEGRNIHDAAAASVAIISRRVPLARPALVGDRIVTVSFGRPSAAPDARAERWAILAPRPGMIVDVYQ